MPRQGDELLLLGEGDPWPTVGRLVGEAVASGAADRGIVCCWTGTGVSIAASLGEPSGLRPTALSSPVISTRELATPSSARRALTRSTA